jgi:hypothetical protein
LNAKNWSFIKDGLDDFRDGLPPPVEGDIMLKVMFQKPKFYLTIFQEFSYQYTYLLATKQSTV